MWASNVTGPGGRQEGLNGQHFFQTKMKNPVTSL